MLKIGWDNLAISISESVTLVVSTTGSVTRCTARGMMTHSGGSRGGLLGSYEPFPVWCGG